MTIGLLGRVRFGLAHRKSPVGLVSFEILQSSGASRRAPGGAGQEAIYEGIADAEKHVIAGSGHSTIFDNSEEHNRVVIDFFNRHSPAEANA